MKKVLFVCMGNICRSPSAEAVFKRLLKSKSLLDEFVVDSAGTHSYHIGSLPDKRSIKAALNRGIDMRSIRARKVEVEDFARFDHVIAMDDSNCRDLVALCPDLHQHKISRMLEGMQGSGYQEVPDPYYGQGDGFELVLDLLEEASRNWLAKIHQ